MSTPKILETRELARSRFFRIEEMDLRFANGVERTYERIPAQGRDAVIVVPVTAAGEVLLIREYAAGFHEIQLSLPKGAAEKGEDVCTAAERELREEIGFGAKRLQFLKNLSIAPGHMGFTINVVLATELFAARIPGDEPEPPEVVAWPMDQLEGLMSNPQFGEARAVAALWLAQMALANAKTTS